MKRLLSSAVVFAISVSAAQAWTTQLESGLSASNRTNTDTTITQNPRFGAYVAGNASKAVGDKTLTIDGRLEFGLGASPEENYETGPMHSGVLGLHYGKNIGKEYVGGFAVLGLFDGVDDAGNSTKTPQFGGMAGVEVKRQLSASTSVLAQLGYASFVGDPTDSRFDGFVAHVELHRVVNDRLSLVFGADHGNSPESFVDLGDGPGEFFGLSATAEYKLNDRIILVGGVNSLRVEDYDDGDTGTDMSVYLGGRIALGGGAVPATHRLSTPIQTFRAAGWMEALD